LLAPPEAPPLMVLLAYNGDEADASPFLHEMHALAARSSTPARSERIALGRIGAGDSEALAKALLRRRRTRPGQAAEVAREAAGNPLLLEGLVRFAHTDQERPPRGPIDRTPNLEERRALLRHMVEQRVAELPAEWQRFLIVVSLALRPIDVETAQ